MEKYTKSTRPLTLVVLAAGLGSRYGGLKQIDPVGPCGEFLMDYSIFDALAAGFRRVVFVIRKDMEELFREKAGRRIEASVSTEYVFQSLDDLPAGHAVPEGRTKPWGTVHAVLSCRNTVDTPFIVINGDDYYGRSGYALMADFLLNRVSSLEKGHYCMLGFPITKTLSDKGTVSRGICVTDNEGYLESVVERKKIRFESGIPSYTENGESWLSIPTEATASMNLWGFTPDIFPVFEAQFQTFIQSAGTTGELCLSTAVDELLAQGKARVKVLPASEDWYGVTYPEDKPMVKAALSKLISKGFYPAPLWPV